MKQLLLISIALLTVVVAKAAPVITPIAGEDMAYKITISEPADLPGGGPQGSSSSTFYEDEDGNIVTVGEVKKLVITTNFTDANMKLNNGEINALKNNYTSLSYLDLENSAVNNNVFGNGSNQSVLNSMSQLKTLVFPKADGLYISKQAFQNNQSLETVIFPDNDGTYEIMENAFRNAKIKTLSMGRGYTISDMAQSGGIWKSASGSGLGIFEHCSQLKNVVLDNSIKNLGEKAFTATFALEYVVLPEELEHMGPLCFKESALRTVTIPDHVVLTGSSSPQVFQGCVWLRNIFVNADNIPCDMQGVMEMGQTSNFKWNPEVDQSNPTYSVNDYVGSGNEAWHSTYGDECPFNNQTYTVPVFHYPGTVTAIENYRVPKYLHYSNVDPETGTTWPKASEINIYNSITEDGVTYRGFDYSTEANSGFGGWRQFPLGSNTFKEQRVFYDERIKESRWYSICLPINMTEAQFMTAYGVGAALHEFTGAEYDEENNMIVLKFDTPAQVDANGYLLKKNVPYMIHPAKIKFSKRKEVQIVDMNGGVEFIKETNEETGQTDYATTEVIATFDVESDLFVNWQTLLNGGEAYANAIANVESRTTDALEAMAQTRRFTNDKFPSVDYTFKGSYLGATIYGPADAGGQQKKMGTSPTLPVGAYYLGYQSGMSEPKFFKAKGTAIWSPYCALVEASNVTGGGDSGAKDFNVLDVDFNTTDIVVTKIGSPTIQIPVIKTDSKVYNLNGQVVRENSKDTNGLKGIYVVGGKKVVFN